MDPAVGIQLPIRSLESILVGSNGADRRRFPRVQADIVWRPVGLGLLHHQRNVTDLSLGGIRALSDEPLTIGSRIECDLLPPAGLSIRAWGRVVWSEQIERDGVTAYECGIEFTDLDPVNLQRLAALAVRDV